jgi:DNA repair protein RadC
MRERFYILLINNANRVIGHVELSSGGITGTVVDIRLAFASALKALSTSIIMAHNHPSGNLKPSQADLNLSRKFKDAGKFLDIQVLDHIILDAESLFYSLSDNADF